MHRYRIMLLFTALTALETLTSRNTSVHLGLSQPTNYLPFELQTNRIYIRIIILNGDVYFQILYLITIYLLGHVLPVKVAASTQKIDKLRYAPKWNWLRDGFNGRRLQPTFYLFICGFLRDLKSLFLLLFHCIFSLGKCPVCRHVTTDTKDTKRSAQSFISVDEMNCSLP